MRTRIYPGEHAFWTLRQCAWAAAQYGHGLPADAEGLALVQQNWREMGDPPPPKDYVGDLSWALAAFRNLDRATMTYEPTPA